MFVHQLPSHWVRALWVGWVGTFHSLALPACARQQPGLVLADGPYIRDAHTGSWKSTGACETVWEWAGHVYLHSGVISVDEFILEFPTRVLASPFDSKTFSH